MSKLDDIIDGVYKLDERDGLMANDMTKKQQVKDLMLELIGEAPENMPIETYNAFLKVKVEEL